MLIYLALINQRAAVVNVIITLGSVNVGFDEKIFDKKKSTYITLYEMSF